MAESIVTYRSHQYQSSGSSYLSLSRLLAVSIWKNLKRKVLSLSLSLACSLFVFERFWSGKLKEEIGSCLAVLLLLWFRDFQVIILFGCEKSVVLLFGYWENETRLDFLVFCNFIKFFYYCWKVKIKLSSLKNGYIFDWLC